VASGLASEVPPPGRFLAAWATERLATAGIDVAEPATGSAPLVVARHVNPFYLHGDFDGDCQLDVAVLVRNRSTGETGLAMLLRAAPGVAVLGAGTPAGNGGTSFDWLDAWHVRPRGPVERGGDEAPPPTLRGDALLVENVGAASALVYFADGAFRWYQQGD